MSWYFVLRLVFCFAYVFFLQVFSPDNRVVILKIPVFKNRAGKTKVFGIETFISLGGLQNGEKVDKMEKTLQLGECGKGGGRSKRRGENKHKNRRAFLLRLEKLIFF